MKPKIGTVYRFRFNTPDSKVKFIKVKDVVYTDFNKEFVTYTYCNDKGIFLSIRNEKADVVVKQPCLMDSDTFNQFFIPFN